MFRTVPLSWSCSQAVSKPVWHIQLLCVQWTTPDNGQRNCPKHVEFYSKNKFEKLVRLVGFIIRNFHIVAYRLCQLYIRRNGGQTYWANFGLHVEWNVCCSNVRGPVEVGEVVWVSLFLYWIFLIFYACLSSIMVKYCVFCAQWNLNFLPFKFFLIAVLLSLLQGKITVYLMNFYVDWINFSQRVRVMLVYKFSKFRCSRESCRGLRDKIILGKGLTEFVLFVRDLP